MQPPLILILYRISNYKAEKLAMVFSSLNDFSIFPHSNTCDFVAQNKAPNLGYADPWFDSQ